MEEFTSLLDVSVFDFRRSIPIVLETCRYVTINSCLVRREVG